MKNKLIPRAQFGLSTGYIASKLSVDNSPRVGTFTWSYPNKNLSKISHLDFYRNELSKNNGITRSIEITDFGKHKGVPYKYEPSDEDLVKSILYDYPIPEDLYEEKRDTTYTSDLFPLMSLKLLKKKFNKK